MIKLSFEVDPGLRGFLRDPERTARFAVSQTLNDLANQVQREVGERLVRDWRPRNATFIRRQLYRKPGEDWATRHKLQAAVRANPRRDLVSKHEQGGPQRPLRGAHLAVPNPHRFPGGKVPRGQYPANLRNNPRVFVIEAKDGKRHLVQRVGRGDATALRFLYRLVRGVVLQPTLGLERTGNAVVQRDAEAVFGRRFDAALKTAHRK